MYYAIIIDTFLFAFSQFIIKCVLFFVRDASCEIRIQLPSVSNVECKLEKDENGLFTLKLINAVSSVAKFVAGSI